MASKRTPLEAFKFGVYLLLPVGTIAVFNQPDMIKKLIETREYIVYPPEGERPPQGGKAELNAALEKIRAKNTENAAVSSAVAEEPAQKKGWFW